MSIDSFAQSLITQVKQSLSSEYDDAAFTVMRRTKAGNQPATGICIQRPNLDTSLCFEIDNLYRHYENGIDLPVLTDVFTKWVTKYTPSANFQTQWVTDFTKAKDCIVHRLIDIRPSRNDEYLKGRSGNRIGNTDIGIIYELDMSSFVQNPDFTIPITDDLLKHWDIPSLDTITVHAAKNTPVLRPPKLIPLMDIYGKYISMDLEKSLNETNGLEKCMYVLTNTAQYHGASTILYPEIQKALDSIFPDGYYVLPSSVHETIIVPQNVMHPSCLLDMVTNINHTMLAGDDILADDVFIIKNGSLVSVI